jgi:hypothetical protein
MEQVVEPAWKTLARWAPRSGAAARLPVNPFGVPVGW